MSMPSVCFSPALSGQPRTFWQQCNALELVNGGLIVLTCTASLISTYRPVPLDQQSSGTAQFHNFVFNFTWMLGSSVR
jgi:hypothetical protein